MKPKLKTSEFYSILTIVLWLMAIWWAEYRFQLFLTSIVAIVIGLCAIDEEDKSAK